jgi:copper chaperone CopZ
MTKKLKCKNCGNTSFETPLKTWQMFSPLPDADGNITITIMGSFECPNCGKNVKGALKKIKTSQEEGSSYAKRENLLEALKSPTSGSKLDLKDLSTSLDIDIGTLKKVIAVYIKKGAVSGRLTNDSFVRE